MEYRIIFGITFGIAFVFYVIFSIEKSNIYCFNIFNQSFRTNMGKMQSSPNFPKSEHFLPPDLRVSIRG